MNIDEYQCKDYVIRKMMEMTRANGNYLVGIGQFGRIGELPLFGRSHAAAQFLRVVALVGQQQPAPPPETINPLSTVIIIIFKTKEKEWINHEFMMMRGACLLFVVPPGAGGGASVGRMPSQFDVDALPEFIADGRLVASGALHFGEEHEQIHWKKKRDQSSLFIFFTAWFHLLSGGA